MFNGKFSVQYIDIIGAGTKYEFLQVWVIVFNEIVGGGGKWCRMENKKTGKV